MALRERLDMLRRDRVARRLRSAGASGERGNANSATTSTAPRSMMQHGARLLLKWLRPGDGAERKRGAYTRPRAARGARAATTWWRGAPPLVDGGAADSPSATPASLPACAHGSTSPKKPARPRAMNRAMMRWQKQGLAAGSWGGRRRRRRSTRGACGLLVSCARRRPRSRRAPRRQAERLMINDAAARARWVAEVARAGAHVQAVAAGYYGVVRTRGGSQRTRPLYVDLRHPLAGGRVSSRPARGDRAARRRRRRASKCDSASRRRPPRPAHRWRSRRCSSAAAADAPHRSPPLAGAARGARAPPRTPSGASGQRCRLVGHRVGRRRRPLASRFRTPAARRRPSAANRR